MLSRSRLFRHDAQPLNRQTAHVGDKDMLMKTQRDAIKELEDLFSEDRVSFPDEDGQQ